VVHVKEGIATVLLDHIWKNLRVRAILWIPFQFLGEHVCDASRTTTTTTKQTSYDENSFHYFRDTHVDISLLLCSIRIPFYTIADGGIVRRLLTLKCRWHRCWMCMHHCHIRQILGKFCLPPSIPFVLCLYQYTEASVDKCITGRSKSP